jgi:hypothetical protein
MSWVDGANRVTIEGLADADGSVADATVQAVVTVRGDEPMEAVTLAPVDSTPGNYSGVIPRLEGARGKRINLHVTATSGATVRHWYLDEVVT